MTLQQQFSNLSTSINTLLGLLFELLSPEVVSIAGKAVRKTSRPQKDPSVYMESQVSVNFKQIPQCDGAINSTIVLWWRMMMWAMLGSSRKMMVVL